MSMMQALAEAGHNITVVITIRPKVKCENMQLIVIPMSKAQEHNLEQQMSTMAGQKNSIFMLFKRVQNMLDSQLDLLSVAAFQRVYETKFDLMFLGYILNDLHLGLAAKLRVPLILAWVQAPAVNIDTLVGNPTNPSYIPRVGTAVKSGEIMGFGKRLQNFSNSLIFQLMMLHFKHQMQYYYKQQFGHIADFPTLQQMRRNVSLVFTNSHSISEGPIRPLVPGIIEIGGIQIKQHPNALPKDISDFLDDAEHGVILLSLGSNIKSSAVKPHLVQSMFKVLSKLKQRVIWKWEQPEMTPGLAANILYKQWLPQDDILAHPKIKLFITHAGKGGITEAQYHGVPMLALPIFGDQPTNAENMQLAGYGLTLELLSLNEQNFKQQLNELLTNKKYAQAIRRFSRLYRDRPLSARQTVLYWTEYVLRHHGAVHLQSTAVHMSFIAYHNLDVYAFLISVATLLLLLAKLVIKIICCSLSQKRKKVK
ncbi:Ugt37c1, partial [Drosophila busckii]